MCVFHLRVGLLTNPLCYCKVREAASRVGDFSLPTNRGGGGCGNTSLLTEKGHKKDPSLLYP